jgi:hypothetical protein
MKMAQASSALRVAMRNETQVNLLACSLRALPMRPAHSAASSVRSRPSGFGVGVGEGENEHLADEQGGAVGTQVADAGGLEVTAFGQRFETRRDLLGPRFGGNGAGGPLDEEQGIAAEADGKARGRCPLGEQRRAGQQEQQAEAAGHPDYCGAAAEETERTPTDLRAGRARRRSLPPALPIR